MMFEIPAEMRHLNDIRDLAISLMTEHGLRPGEPGGWTLKFGMARTVAGECDRKAKIISLSDPLMSLWTMEQCRDTILHEIAHAITDYRGGRQWHGRAWQFTCLRIGADPTRTWGHNGEEKLPWKYTGTCPAGHTIRRHKVTVKTRQLSCSRCSTHYDTRYLFTWTED